MKLRKPKLRNSCQKTQNKEETQNNGCSQSQNIYMVIHLHQRGPWTHDLPPNPKYWQNPQNQGWSFRTTSRGSQRSGTPGSHVDCTITECNRGWKWEFLNISSDLTPANLPTHQLMPYGGVKAASSSRSLLTDFLCCRSCRKQACLSSVDEKRNKQPKFGIC